MRISKIVVGLLIASLSCFSYAVTLDGKGHVGKTTVQKGKVTHKGYTGQRDLN